MESITWELIDPHCSSFWLKEIDGNRVKKHYLQRVHLHLFKGHRRRQQTDYILKTQQKKTTDFVQSTELSQAPSKVSFPKKIEPTALFHSSIRAVL